MQRLDKECFAGPLVLRLGAALRACLVKSLLLHKPDALETNHHNLEMLLLPVHWNVTVYGPITASTGDTRGVDHDDDDDENSV